MRILILDNYDSFVYNIAQLIQTIKGVTIDVIKNDKITLEEVDLYDKIILSPGPGLPENAGIMPSLINRYGATKPILGICLGHQGLCESFGASLHNLKDPLHGIATTATQKTPHYIFEGIAQSFLVGHYHSWVVRINDKSPLRTLAVDEQGNCMAAYHPEMNWVGLQFHPESLLTPEGIKILENWVMHQSTILEQQRPINYEK